VNRGRGNSRATACFLRYCLLTPTDRLIMMVRPKVAGCCGRAAVGADAALGDWAALYEDLLTALGAIFLFDGSWRSRVGANAAASVQ
jgi:hypothetical protein